MHRLVVCTGNTCRSPMAQALVQAFQADGDDVRSAGLSVTGAAASVFAVMAMKEKGIDLSFHHSKLLTQEDVDWADEIAVMTPAHKVAVTSVFSVDPDKVQVLGKGIPDPFGGSLEDYRLTRDVLETAVKQWIASAVKVVPMAREHLSQLAAVEQACFTSPWSEAALAEELDNPCAAFLVAEQGGEAVGYLGAHIVTEDMTIANIAVTPAHRRRGIASALLDRAKEVAAERSLERITLEVRVSNDAAIRLYETHGFVKDGIRPHFYAHPDEDAAIYSLYLHEKEAYTP